MDKSNRILVGACALLLAVFAAGVVYLFSLRFESGDVYPPYSTFRSDPLGMRALYSALDEIPGITPRRNLESLQRIGSGEDTTLVLCGASTSKDPEKLIGAIERFAAKGGRLVVAFRPVAEAPLAWADDEEDKDTKPPAEKPGKNTKKGNGDSKKEKIEHDDKDVEPLIRFASLEERWHFSHAYGPLPGGDDYTAGKAEVVRAGESGALPERLPWHSAMYFAPPEPKESAKEKKTETGEKTGEQKPLTDDSDKTETPADTAPKPDEPKACDAHGDDAKKTDAAPVLGAPWRVVYTWGKQPVVIERDWESGTIVLLSDSFLFSNEAMQKERHPALLAWLMGPSSKIVFDETHLGVAERPGIMALVRRFRFTGFLVSFVLIAGLLVWRHSSSLVPRREMLVEEAASWDPERDAGAGLVSLLRRGIAPRRLLRTCLDEWERSQGSRGPRIAPAALERARAIVAREEALSFTERNPVAAYRALAAVLTERKGHRERKY